MKTEKGETAAAAAALADDVVAVAAHVELAPVNVIPFAAVQRVGAGVFPRTTQRARPRSLESG